MNDFHQRIATSFGAQSLMATLGARLVHVEPDEVHIEMPFADHLLQQQGFVHAGAINSILDSACGYAALTRAPEGSDVVTAEFKTNFVRPALGERFLAVGRVASVGRQLAVVTGEVRAFAAGTAEPKVVALMQATVVFVQPR